MVLGIYLIGLFKGVGKVLFFIFFFCKLVVLIDIFFEVVVVWELGFVVIGVGEVFFLVDYIFSDYVFGMGLRNLVSDDVNCKLWWKLKINLISLLVVGVGGF